MTDNENIEDPFVKCDCCECVINMDKYGYYILQKDNDEKVWCQDCYFSELYIKMKEKGWKCDDDSLDE
jgi:hypothetical protein